MSQFSRGIDPISPVLFPLCSGRTGGSRVQTRCPRECQEETQLLDVCLPPSKASMPEPTVRTHDKNRKSAGELLPVIEQLAPQVLYEQSHRYGRDDKSQAVRSRRFEQGRYDKDETAKRKLNVISVSPSCSARSCKRHPSPPPSHAQGRT